MEGLHYRFAKKSDIPKISELLSANSLPFGDIDNHITNFLVVEEQDQLIGVVGLETIGNTALLRSLAVVRAERSKGIGLALIDRIKSYSLLNKIGELYLLTTTAEEYFEKRGFKKIDRDAIPEGIRNTKEFRSICPSTAVCMMQEIRKHVQVYTKDILRLKEDVPGAKMWGVSLEKTMLTYFEVEAESRFGWHTHESEQITMVLEGELYFEMDGRITCVRSGEVIAIPSSVPHAVYTKEMSVKAVDAWSPIMDKYE
jgi:amino-acid N-acetyltransferase